MKDRKKENIPNCDSYSNRLSSSVILAKSKIEGKKFYMLLQDRQI
jgi:hypothetical protein